MDEEWVATKLNPWKWKTEWTPLFIYATTQILYCNISFDISSQGILCSL